MKKKLQTAFSTRQYMLSRDFELYYYNDRNLKKVDLHTHSYYEFYFFLEGDVSIRFGKEQYELKSGDIVVIPPGVSHQPIIHSADIPYRRFVFWISREFCMHLISLSEDYGYLMKYVAENQTYVFHNDRITFNGIQSRVLALLEELHSSRFARDTQISLCVSDLVLHLNRVVYEKTHLEAGRTEQSLYLKILAYIEGHMEEELSLDSLAGVFFVNKYHIAHMFKDNLGISVHQYILKKRLALCRTAILGGGNISEAYLRFGFRDYSSFYRAFKKEYGLSPRDFRDQHREPPLR